MRILTNSRVVLVAVLAVVGSAAGHATERVSVSSSGEEANDFSFRASVSADGRYVAFHSHADNLVEGDTNGSPDVFLHDRETGETTRLSVDHGGAQGNGVSDQASISGDGRYVAFRSAATNMVPFDTNGFYDIFVRDRETGLTVCASVSSAGEEADDDSEDPSLSADGRYVAFRSNAENLDPSGKGGVFVHDLMTRETTKVSLTNLGGHAWGEDPAISGDGRYVAFASTAKNLDFGDPTDDWDIYIRDRLLEVTIWASPGPVAPDTDSVAPAISADGRFVAFTSEADNLIPNGTGLFDVYLFEIETSELSLVSKGPNGEPADSHSGSPALTADGRVVAFTSRADNLGPGDFGDDYQVFVHDRDTGQNAHASISTSGNAATNHCQYPVISGNGRLVAFETEAGGLVPDDGNGKRDIFVHDLGASAFPERGRLFGSETAGQLLVTIDPLSGESAGIGFISDHFDGFAYDPVNDVLYGINTGDDRIYTFDKETAAAAPIGAPGFIGFNYPGGLAFDPIRGILYANDETTNVLYSIDTTTGLGTPVATITGTYSFQIAGLAFDPRSDTLFGLASDSDAVVKIDPTSGVTIPIVTGLSPLGHWSGLSFDTDRNVLCATRFSDGTDLSQIDPGTGDVTLVGPAGGPGAAVRGIAFVAPDEPSNCPPDLNGNGAVEISDFLLLLASWGTSPEGPPDLDGDGIVAVGDFLILLANWGPCPVFNDDCLYSIDVTEGVHEFSTTTATTDGPDHVECDFSGFSQIDNDVWFCYTASATGSATAGVCGSSFNTKLTVYSGRGCPPPEPPLACDDDACGTQSEVSFPVTAGEAYLIRVGGYDGAAGDGALTINCQSFDIPNDGCSFATPIFVPFVVNGTTRQHHARRPLRPRPDGLRHGDLGFLRRLRRARLRRQQR
jgi:Tol biopolymer transport system component